MVKHGKAWQMSKTVIEHFMDLKLPFFMILCLEKAV